MKSILVTGGCGFIGSHLIDTLLDRNHKVICIDNLDTFYKPELKLLNQKKHLDYGLYHFHEGDIRDRNFLHDIFKKYEFDHVVHLAAMAGVRLSIADPVKYMAVNINGTQNLLEEIKHQKIKKFIFASSSSVYGNNSKLPFAEQDKTDQQISAYGATKKMGEELCYVYAHLYQIPTVCLRFFTVYGPRQRPEMAIHKFVRHILKGQPLPFFGDGNTARDYTYIDDIVRGIIPAMETDDDFMIYNLGNAEPVKLKDLIAIICEITNKKALLDEQELPQGDVQFTYADITTAKTRLDFSPSTDIYNGINHFVTWYQKMKMEHSQLF